MPSESIDISVVLPVHNEAEHLTEEIGRIRRGLDRSGYSYEIIVVDDASTDGSREILHGLDGITLIELAENQGSGTARRLGTQRARGGLVAWSDADMTYPNEQIAALADELVPGYDQVVGARTSERGSHRWARVPAKFFIRKLAEYLVRRRIPDLNSGFRVFRREVALPYLYLLPSGFSCVTTLTLAFLSRGHPIKYVPIDYRKRAGRSKFHPLRDSAVYVMQVIRMIMTFNPLRVFMPIGLLMLAVAAAKVGYDAFDKNLRITSNAIILTIVSLQIVATGLIADLVARLARRDE
jgi:glycosyltransferase involved in cell wall biosynthesis